MVEFLLFVHQNNEKWKLFIRAELISKIEYRIISESEL